MMWSRGSIGRFQSFAGAARRRQRLELEQLEDRCVLSGAGVLLPSQTAIPLGSMALQALRYQLALPAGMPLFAAAGQSPQMDYLYSSGHSATFDLTYQTNVPVTSGGLDATMMTDGKALQIELWAKPVSPADSKPSQGGGGQGTGSWSFPGVQDLGTLSGRFHLYGGIKEGGFPTAITAGPDGDLWFLMELDNQVMRFSPETGLFTVFTIPSYSPQGITAGPDGNLWFTESLANKIGRLTPDGTLTEFALNTESSPDGITAGKDGNLWFTEMPGKIGRLTPADGTITDFALPAGIAAGKITAGPDGNLWFTIGTSYTEGNKIGRLSPTGDFKEFSDSAVGGAVGITAGPDGNVWFTEADAPTVPDIASHHNKVARITPDGVIAEFDIPGAPMGITTGPDGNLWIAEANGSIGRFTPAGTFTEFKIPAKNIEPVDITVGRDGNIWFTDFISRHLGELVLADLPNAANANGSSSDGGSSPLNNARTSPALNPENPATLTAALWWTGQNHSLEFSSAYPGSQPVNVKAQPDTGRGSGQPIAAAVSLGTATESVPAAARLSGSQRMSAEDPLAQTQSSSEDDAGAPFGALLAAVEG